ncbi:ras and Rab interactor-like protein isoform X2 [Ochotona princeps]|uniref:ras and Rab interactor-like protein isoform X2 n=1 Tax=Ochotona princeps TaxID=9978 RepID=UPI0027150B31|nr:ras and Rab interactor-like protein isoform X2 [Ochotona princeps]
MARMLVTSILREFTKDPDSWVIGRSWGGEGIQDLKFSLSSSEAGLEGPGQDPQVHRTLLPAPSPRHAADGQGPCSHFSRGTLRGQPALPGDTCSLGDGAKDWSEAPSRIPGPHQVSWVEAPPTPKVRHLTLNSLEEEEQEEDDYQDEEKGPEDVLTAHVRALARARSSYVAGQYRGLRARLASCSGNPHRPGDPATELLQDVRNLLLDLQDHLAKDPSVRAILGSRGPRDQQKQKDLGLTVEAAVCRAVLAPLKPVLWMRLRTFRAPELRRLRRRQMALRAGAGPEGQSPALAQRSQIHERLAHLHAACAPRRKVALLLAVCSDVYAGLACGEGQEPQGADAFLPALTEELIWSPDIGETQLDVEFLMELLDPDELRGEAGYYLTTWFGALHHIAHYQPDAGRAPQGLSNEARASLHQWHRRRTLHRLDQTGSRAELPLDGPWAVEAEQGTCDN